MVWMLIYLVLVILVSYSMNSMFGNNSPKIESVPVCEVPLANPYELPPPGTNLELFNRVTTVLDASDAARIEAIKERDEARNERDKYKDALEIAKSILHQWAESNFDSHKKAPAVKKKDFSILL